jgi:predicted dienelactone hydrolase
MKIHRLLAIGTFLLLRGIVPSHADPAYHVGLGTSAATVPERGKTIELSLWYPAKQDGHSELFGDSKIFKGVPVRRNASFADGMFPVIVLAHGGLRANPGLAGWIAADLASRGNFVVSVHAPQLTETDAAMAIDEVWLRPSDLSAALSAIKADSAMTAHLNPDKVAAVGFFLGGTSALTLVGARLDADSYRRSCDQPRTGPDCKWFAKSGIDLHKADDEVVSKSHLDARIKLAVAVNPELSTSFATESLSAIKVPVQVIALGPTNVDFQEHIPNARYAAISDAAPFSAFSQCTSKAPALLAEEGEDDAICRDGGSRSREEIQAEIGSIIEAALAAGFQE